jgi:7-cyano-7-deazaguanine synthase
LALAARDGDVVIALTFQYGQRAAEREREAAAALCDHYGIRHQVVELPFLAAITRTALVNTGVELPNPDPADLDDPDRSRRTAAAVWVPNRNGLFLNAAACYAESLGATRLVTGFNAEEGATFPDNTPAFVRATNAALGFSTGNGVRVESPVAAMDKTAILKEAQHLGVPLAVIWSCYLGGERMCGRCESCRRLRRACAGAGHPELWEELAGSRGSAAPGRR